MFVPSLRDHILTLPVAQYITAVPFVLLRFLAILSRKKNLVPVPPPSPEMEVYISFYKGTLPVFKSNINKFFCKILLIILWDLNFEFLFFFLLFLLSYFI